MSARSPLPSSLVLVGAGKMGGAMLEGWLAVGLAPSCVEVLEPNPSDGLAALAAERGFRLHRTAAGIAVPDVVVLAIKPQSLDDAAGEVSRLVGPETLVISVLAGKTVHDLRQRLPDARAIVRAMPNLPASIRRGATGAAATAEVGEHQKRVADALLAGIGRVEWVASEDLIDAVTAVSGSGPAYVFYLVECLARAGASAGLPADVAERLARATVAGAGALLDASDAPAETLRRNVTSPGGTTAAALDVLMAEDGLAPLMRAAVAAAKQRGEELSG